MCGGMSLLLVGLTSGVVIWARGAALHTQGPSSNISGRPWAALWFARKRLSPVVPEAEQGIPTRYLASWWPSGVQVPGITIFHYALVTLKLNIIS